MGIRIWIPVLIAGVLTTNAAAQSIQTSDKNDSIQDVVLKPKASVRTTSDAPDRYDSGDALLQDVYNEYLEEYRKNFRCSFLTLSNLAKAVQVIYSNDAFECLNSLFVFHHRHYELRKLYYDRVKREAGIEAAQAFLRMTGGETRNSFTRAARNKPVSPALEPLYGCELRPKPC